MFTVAPQPPGRGVGAVTVAKAYRLLAGGPNTAVAAQLTGKNPCAIPGASQEQSPERPTATVEQVFTTSDAMPRPYRLLVLLTCVPSMILDDLKIDLKGHARRTARLPCCSPVPSAYRSAGPTSSRTGAPPSPRPVSRIST